MRTPLAGKVNVRCTLIPAAGLRSSGTESLTSTVPALAASSVTRKPRTGFWLRATVTVIAGGGFRTVELFALPLTPSSPVAITL